MDQVLTSRYDSGSETTRYIRKNSLMTLTNTDSGATCEKVSKKSFGPGYWGIQMRLDPSGAPFS